MVNIRYLRSVAVILPQEPQATVEGPFCYGDRPSYGTVTASVLKSIKIALYLGSLLSTTYFSRKRKALLNLIL